MADVHSPQIRSYNMSRVKGKDTKPELIVRRYLHAKGYRYRLHVKKLPGCPDIVLSKYKTIVFVHGCFWHGHENCKKATLPKTRTSWWFDKIGNNIKKDKKFSKLLTEIGWNVIVIWSCQLEAKTKEKYLNNLLKQLLIKHNTKP